MPIQSFYFFLHAASSVFPRLCLLLGLLYAAVAPAAVLTVTNNSDSGAGSLRNTITAAAAGDTINFDASYTITLTTSGLTINKGLTIDGSGQSITISGDNTFKIFDISGGATVTLNQLTLRDGDGSGTNGGAILVTNTPLVINSCIFDSNTANAAGAIKPNPADVQINNSLFINNSSTSTQGGAIHTTSGSTLTIYNSTFDNNSGQGVGGAINLFSSTLTLYNSTFVNNSAASGGGMNINSAGSATLRNNTFSANSSSDGGNLRIAGSAALYNNILANHSGGGDCTVGGTITANVNNLIEDGSCTTGAVDMVIADPNLGPLQDNGGPVQTMALLPGSPAINVGDNTTCTDAATVNSLDARGQPRPTTGTHWNRCDIGAYEFQPPAKNLVVSATVDVDELDTDTSFGDNSLREAVYYADAGDTITFDTSIAGQTIALADQIILGKDLIIDGGANSITINGGGGFRVFELTGATVTLKSLTLSNGNPGGSNGGAILMDDASDLSLEQCTFSSNVGGTGGAIRNNNGILSVKDSVFSDNTASAAAGGGAIYNDNAGTLTVVNSTFTGNSAQNAGAAIRAGFSNITVLNSTISGNGAALAGAGSISVATGATRVLKNTILANNTGGGDCKGDFLVHINNLIEDGSCTTGAMGLVIADPNLGALQDNGGPVQTMVLLPGSPAVNAGDNTACADAATVNNQDARGVIRPQSANCSIGAYEKRPPAFSSTAVTAVNEDVVYTYNITTTDNEPTDGAWPAITAPTLPTWLTLTDNGNGTATLSGTPTQTEVGTHNVVLSLNEGTEDVQQSFTITVTNVNDTPSFTAADPPAVDEDAGAQTVGGWVTAFDPGTGESDGVFAYSVSNVGNTGLFSAGPAVDVSGNLTYTPAAGLSGTSTFDVTVQDDGGTANGGLDTSVPQTFIITVNSVNDQPSFTAADPPAVDEDPGTQSVAGWATFDPGTGDSDGVLAYTVGNLSNSALFSSAPAVDTGGTLTYTPAADVNGTCTFDVTVQDDGGTPGVDTSVTQTFTITVNPLNDAPSFTAAAPAPVSEDVGLVTVSAWASFSPGGGTDEAGQGLLAYNVSNVSNPALFSVAPAVDTGGNLTYTVAANTNGSATFEVTVQDDGGTANGGVDTSAAQTFTITVNVLNDAPVLDFSGDPELPDIFEDDSLGSVVSVNDLVTLPLDIISDGDAGAGEGIALISVDDSNGAWQYSLDSGASWNAAGPVSDTGARLLAADGVSFIRFVPAADYAGTAAITFRAWDQSNGLAGGSGGVDVSANGGATAYSAETEIATVSVLPVNDAPSFSAANPPEAAEDAGPQSLSAWVSFSPGGGTDEAGQSVLVYSVSNLSNPALFSVPPAVSATGELTYTPAPNNNGFATFEVSVQDDGGTANGGFDTSASRIFTISVGAVDDLPVITQGDTFSASMSEDGAASLALDAGDADSPSLSWSVASPPQYGSATVSGDFNATVNYTPAPDYAGGDSFVVQVSDGSGTDTITVNVNIVAVNDAPGLTASNPPPVNAGAPPVVIPAWITFSPGGGADEANQTVLAYSVGNISDPALFSVPPAVDDSGTLSYTLAPGGVGSASFTVTVQDDGGTVDGGVDVSPAQTFSIEVLNGVPMIAQGASTTLSVLEDSGSASLILNAADENGDTLAWSIVTQATQGVADLAVAGNQAQVYYTPLPDYAGGDNFSVRVDDGHGNFAQITVQVTVTPVNDAPFLNAFDPPAVEEDSGTHSIRNWALFNPGGGADEAGQNLVAYSVTGVSNPALFDILPQVGMDGSLFYSVAPETSGTSSFSVTVRDDGGSADGGVDTSTAYRFLVSVDGSNDAPRIEQGDSLDLSVDKNGDTSVMLNADDPENDPLNWRIDKVPENGSAELFGSGGQITLSYTPAPHYFGPDGVTLTVEDGNGGSDNITVAIQVLGENETPVILEGGAGSYTTDADTALEIVLHAEDPEGAPPIWSVTAAPANGSVQNLDNGGFVYTPKPGFTGSDSFSVEVGDGAGGRALYTATVEVVRDNRAPVLLDGNQNTYNMPADTGLEIVVYATDPDGEALIWRVAAFPADATLDNAGNGSFTYHPNPGFSGNDGFQIEIADAAGASVSYSVGITVEAPADPASGTEPDPGTVPDPGTDPLPGTDPEPGTDPIPGTDPEPGTNPIPGTDPDPGTGPLPEADPAPIPEPDPLSPEQVVNLSPDELENLSPQQIETLPPESVAELAPEQIARLSPALLGALDAEQAAALSPAVVAALAPEQFQSLSPEAVGGLQADQISALSGEVVASFTPTSLSHLSEAGVSGLDGEQFTQLPMNALSGLTADNLGGLRRDVTQQMTPAHLAEINPGATRENPKAAANLVTNLNPDNVRPDDVAILLPEDWQLDRDTGMIEVPPGTKLAFNNIIPELDDPTLSDNVLLPVVPNLNSALSLGGVVPEGEPSLKNSFNTVVETVVANEGIDDEPGPFGPGMIFEQEPNGVVTVTDPNERFGAGLTQLAFLPDSDNIEQAPPDIPPGIDADSGGWLWLTTAQGYRFKLLPSLKKPETVLQQVAAGGILSSEGGGIVMLSMGRGAHASPRNLRRAARAADNNAVAIAPLVFIPNPRVIEVVRSPNPHVILAGGQKQDSMEQDGLIVDADGNTLVVGEDGTTQEIRPTVLEPDIFQAQMRTLFTDKNIEKTVFRSDGTFDLIMAKESFRLYPTFDVYFAQAGHPAPSLLPREDGDLDYAVRKFNRIVVTRVRMEIR